MGTGGLQLAQAGQQPQANLAAGGLGVGGGGLKLGQTTATTAGIQLGQTTQGKGGICIQSIAL